jgi:hypothetical protein
VKELRAEGMLEAATNAAANMAQDEIERLMKLGYTEHEARKVPAAFVLLPPEYHEDEQDRELADMERTGEPSPVQDGAAIEVSSQPNQREPRSDWAWCPPPRTAPRVRTHRPLTISRVRVDRHSPERLHSTIVA